MASLRKRGSNWYAAVRRNGISAYATFSTKAEAQVWAVATESDIVSGKRSNVPDKPFGELLERYKDKVSTSTGGIAVLAGDCAMFSTGLSTGLVGKGKPAKRGSYKKEKHLNYY